MVTGVETAGLVLASIPLILAGLEFYAKGIAVSKRYWKYKTEFKTLVSELRTENCMCINSINMLLLGVVLQKDMPDFLTNPCNDCWKDGQFEKRLKERLGSTYEPYLDTINQINDVLNAFKERLKLDQAGQPRFKEESAFKEHYRRLKFSLNRHDYTDLIQRLRTANGSLYRMTNQMVSLEHLEKLTSRNSKASRNALPKFNVVHDRAKGLYAALCSGWKCQCHSHHCVSLRLETRMEDVESEDDEDEDEDEDTMRDPFRVIFRYAIDLETPSEEEGTKITPWTWEEVDIHITCESQCASSVSSISGSSMKGVRFASKAKKAVKAALDPTPNLQPIQDICTAIAQLQKPQRDVCLSLLATEYAKQKYGMLIYPLKEPCADANTWTISSLRAALQDARFTRQDRLRLAVTLACSVLQLHETPWLEDNWGKDNIFFIVREQADTDNTKPTYGHPFVSQYFNAAGEAEEKNSISPTLSRIIRNQTLYALGVALIELWYGKSLQELHQPQDGATGSAMTEWNTADRLVDELYGDAGEKYSGAVRRCIRCDFDRRASNLDDLGFQKAVYDGVVAQLKENYEFLF